MIVEFKNFTKLLFKGLNYSKYFKKNNFDKLLGIDIKNFSNISKKNIKDPYSNVKTSKDAFAPELDDLCRLHYLAISRKVTTILEFGVGQSTLVLNDALEKNKSKYLKYVNKNLRRSNPFECHSVDNNEFWIKRIKNNYNLNRTIFYKTVVNMGTFNDRVCTFYKNLPNICPDLIYLDAPDLSSIKGSIRGITTNHSDRLPMSADILSIEHFLLPGTLIVIDGRTANARLLKSNFQRNWIYCHDELADQHFFELSEPPLGIYNRLQINYCLGNLYYKRLIQ